MSFGITDFPKALRSLGPVFLVQVGRFAWGASREDTQPGIRLDLRQKARAQNRVSTPRGQVAILPWRVLVLIP